MPVELIVNERRSGIRSSIEKLLVVICDSYWIMLIIRECGRDSRGERERPETTQTALV